MRLNTKSTLAKVESAKSAIGFADQMPMVTLPWTRPLSSTDMHLNFSLL